MRKPGGRGSVFFPEMAKMAVSGGMGKKGWGIRGVEFHEKKHDEGDTSEDEEYSLYIKEETWIL